jgi:hypothetical protein
MKRPCLFGGVVILGLLASGCAQLLQSAGMDPNAAQGTPPEGAAGEAPAAPEPGAEPGAEPAGSDAPAGPTTVSVTIRSECKDTVRVFFGEKPKFGGGKYSTVSSNSSSSYSFKPGDMFWIVDESDNGVASATVSDTTKEITVASSCTSLAAR